MTATLGAKRLARSAERTGERNGHRARTLYTRVGLVRLWLPQSRYGGFLTGIFKRYQRSEHVLALMEMVVQGVSTRKVTAIAAALCGASFSKSTLSSLCVGLDDRVRACNERRLAEFGERFARIAPKSVECQKSGFEAAMAVMALPEK